MSEETPFKSMKITLSDEALFKLGQLRQGGAFRSDSAAIEECIRAINSMIEDLLFEIARSPKDVSGNFTQKWSIERQSEMLRRYLILMIRFTTNIKLP